MAEPISSTSRLALEGGTPVIAQPPAKAPRWGPEELSRLTGMLEQSSLFYWSGSQPNTQTEALLDKFREHYPLRHLMPCTSGSAAIHIAVAASGLAPGEEVITSPLTDMGTVLGILFQQAVPVFADVDPRTFNLDPAAVEALVTERTRAIIPVHFSGNPCDLDALLAIAQQHQLVVIEDCAQSWGAEYQGTPVGLHGDMACWSFNDFKHLSCGDGGMVGSNSESFGPLLQAYGDKGYARDGSGRSPAILAANYRLGEPSAAIAAAQLGKHDAIVQHRVESAALLDRGLGGINGIDIPYILPGCKHSYWFYTPKLDLAAFSCDRDTFVKALRAEGVIVSEFSSPTPVHTWEVFQSHAFFAGGWPLREAGITRMDYTQVECPVTESLYACWFRIILYPGMDKDYCSAVVEAVAKVAEHYRIR